MLLDNFNFVGVNWLGNKVYEKKGDENVWIELTEDAVGFCSKSHGHLSSWFLTKEDLDNFSEMIN